MSDLGLIKTIINYQFLYWIFINILKESTYKVILFTIEDMTGNYCKDVKFGYFCYHNVYNDLRL